MSLREEQCRKVCRILDDVLANRPTERDSLIVATRSAFSALSAQPEIVRCKDCDWWTKQEDSLQGRCALLQMYPTGGWFCGNARRREVTE